MRDGARECNARIHCNSPAMRPLVSRSGCAVCSALCLCVDDRRCLTCGGWTSPAPVTLWSSWCWGRGRRLSGTTRTICSGYLRSRSYVLPKINHLRYMVLHTHMLHCVRWVFAHWGTAANKVWAHGRTFTRNLWLASQIQRLVIDFSNAPGVFPATVTNFSRVYADFCDLLADGCLTWNVEVNLDMPPRVKDMVETHSRPAKRKGKGKGRHVIDDDEDERDWIMAALSDKPGQVRQLVPEMLLG
jgi:hypothetical protein